MTLSTNNTYEQTIASIVKDAMVLAGQMNTKQSISDANLIEDANWCVRVLTSEIDKLLSFGVIMRWTEFKTFSTVVDQQAYTLDSSVVEVIGDMMYKSPTGQGETSVSQVSSTFWHKLTNKDFTSGTPTQFFVERAGEDLQVKLWGVPTEVGTLTYRAHVRPYNGVDSSKTIDCEPYWINYFKSKIAAKYALSKGDLNLFGILNMECENDLKRNLAKSRSRPPIQARVRGR